MTGSTREPLVGLAERLREPYLSPEADRFRQEVAASSHYQALFWQKVDQTLGAFGCWPWTGYVNRRGYGSYSVFVVGRPRLTLLAHRIGYEMVNGMLGEEVLDHICRNRRCCNPRHLEATTPKINLLRGESSVVVNAAKMICKRGHPLEGGNVRLKVHPTKGWVMRCCKACDHLFRIDRTKRERAARTALSPLDTVEKGEGA